MVLRNLKKFIRVHRNEGEAGEVRAYLLTHADAIAEAFAVETPVLLEAVAKVADDDQLCRFALGSIATAQEKGSTGKRDARVSDAQASADVIGSVARVYPWGAVEIDLLSLLASVLTGRPSDLLVFRSEAFESFAVPMSRLSALDRLGRMDLSATVDASGLHVRWTTGGLNLKSVLPSDASLREDGITTITVTLPSLPIQAVAA
jgi:hypothetical protein